MAGMISIPCDPFLFLGSLQDHSFMCHTYCYNRSLQGVITISSLYATFLLSLKDAWVCEKLYPSSKYWGPRSEKTISSTHSIFSLLSRDPMHSFPFFFKFSGLKRSNKARKAEISWTLFSPQKVIL